MSHEVLKTDLNLLPSQAKFQAVKMRMKALAKKITIGVALIWLVVVLTVLTALFGGKWMLNSEKTKYQREMNAFLTMSDSIVTSQIIKFRAKLLGKILTDRFEYYNAFSRVGKLFSAETVIKDFVLKDKSVFKLTLLVNRGGLLDEVEKRVEEINKGEEPGVKKATISSVSYSRPDRSWTVNMEVTLQ